jgi:pilus assembly protein Flp/PilA
MGMMHYSSESHLQTLTRWTGLMKFCKILIRLVRNEDGPTTVEYAVMLALIAGFCIGAVQALTEATERSFRASANAIDSAVGP